MLSSTPCQCIKQDLAVGAYAALIFSSQHSSLAEVSRQDASEMAARRYIRERERERVREREREATLSNRIGSVRFTKY